MTPDPTGPDPLRPAAERRAAAIAAAASPANRHTFIAFSGVGSSPHLDTPPNAATARPVAGRHFAVPTRVMRDGLDATVAAAFARTLATLRGAGAQIDEIGLEPLGEVAAINAGGGFAVAEAWARHRARLADHAAEHDPCVAQRIRRGAAMSAAARRRGARCSAGDRDRARGARTVSVALPQAQPGAGQPVRGA